METKAAKDLEKELLFSQPHISDEWPAAREEAEAFCEDYKAFLNNAKTEREAAAEIEKRLVAAGYRPFGHMAKTALKPGDKVYYNNRGKAILAATIGTRSLEEGAHFMIAHIDSPRLDLKPTIMVVSANISGAPRRFPCMGWCTSAAAKRWNSAWAKRRETLCSA